MPFVTAFVAWAWTGETPDRRLLMAGAVAMAGVAVMVAGGTRLAGMGFALAMNFGMAVNLVNAKRGARAGNAIYTAGTTLSAGVGFAFAPQGGVGPGQVALLAPLGLLTIGLATALYVAGARRTPSAEVGLVSMLDVASGPAPVWLAFGEGPGTATVVGGALVVSALACHLAPDLKGPLRSARAAAIASPPGGR